MCAECDIPNAFTLTAADAMHLQLKNGRGTMVGRHSIPMEASCVTTENPDAPWAKQLLRDHSMRATAARVAVLRMLAAAEGPLSHAEVVEELSDFGFDQSTLFRCLNEIADAGLVARLDLGDQIRRFELRDASSKAEFTHPHFMCVDCGELSCMNDFTVQLSPSRGPRRDKLGTITEIMIRGHCGQCQ